jgi:hypothetical protein
MEPTKMETNSIFAYKGRWNKYNTFIIEETGEVIEIIPYPSIMNKYMKNLPLDCYIQVIYNGSYLVLSDVIPI